MRLTPLPPEVLSPELRYVHDEIANLITRSQQQVVMQDDQGALMGPFPVMLHFPQFGIPALEFLRSLDMRATLDPKIREVAILTVGSAFGARFILYAHEIMAAAVGISPVAIATLAMGERPNNLSDEQAIAHDVAHLLVNGHTLPTSTYQHAVHLLGQEGTGELMFIIGGYSLIAMLLNGFDMPAPDSPAHTG